MTLDLATCPTCGLPAEVLDRYTLPSTSGPVAHVHIRCIQRHHYTGPENR